MCKYKEEEEEKRGKGEIFTVLFTVGKISFLKKGGGAKISFFWTNIHPCVHWTKCNCRYRISTRSLSSARRCATPARCVGRRWSTQVRCPSYCFPIDRKQVDMIFRKVKNLNFELNVFLLKNSCTFIYPVFRFNI